jgi:transposase
VSTDEARTLDWLYAHDLTQLFAGIASRARQVFRVKAEQVHVDTTSFSVSGEYAGLAPRGKQAGEAKEPAVPDAAAALIAIPYGYSRDHRDDLKQWMLARASTQEGAIPLFLQPLDGNRSDEVSLLSAIMTIQTQLREADGEASVYVADNGVGSRATYAAVEPGWSEVGEPGLGHLN